MAKRISLLTWFSLSLLVLLNILSASSASNTVVNSSLGRVVLAPITANDLKPSQCASLNLTVLVVGSGTINHGLGQPALILGSAGTDTIVGSGGSDCILGGGGPDHINGQAGGDILLGGPGSDTLVIGTVCYGGPGNQAGDVDVFISCTTQVP